MSSMWSKRSDDVPFPLQAREALSVADRERHAVRMHGSDRAWLIPRPPAMREVMG
jgi:hypothetical protein